MKFLLDNNLPPSLARALHVLSAHIDESRVEVRSLRDKFPQNAKDVEWITALKGEGGWSIVSRDYFRKSAAERELIRREGFNVFVLQSSWGKYPYWTQAAQLILWWPMIVEYAAKTEKVAVEVPWRLKGKFVQIRI